MRPEEWIGRTLARTYLMESLLGSGGMGAVYCARHLRTRGLVAVKILRPEFATEHEILRRFYLEAQLVAKLRHPHIVQVTDCYESDGSAELPVPFIVMDLLHGEDLHTRLRRVGTLSYLDTHKLALEVGGALQAVHNHNIIHRDIKPMNLFLHRHDSVSSEDEVYKVVDFGVSKTQDNSQPTTGLTFLGTPHYASPESAGLGGGALDSRSDQFSLAVVLYRVLSGRLPFDGEDELRVLYHVRYEDPVPLSTLVPSLPTSAVAAIERAMRKDRDERFPSILEFVQAYLGRPPSAQGRWASVAVPPPASPQRGLLPASLQPAGLLPLPAPPRPALPAFEPLPEPATLPWLPRAEPPASAPAVPVTRGDGPPVAAPNTPEVVASAWSPRQLVGLGLLSFALIATLGSAITFGLRPAPDRRPGASPAAVAEPAPSATPLAAEHSPPVPPAHFAPAVARAQEDPAPSRSLPVPAAVRSAKGALPPLALPAPGARRAHAAAPCPTPPHGFLLPTDAAAERRLQAFLQQGSLCLGRDQSLVFERNPVRSYQFRLRGQAAAGIKYVQLEQLQSWLNKPGHIPYDVETVRISP